MSQIKSKSRVNKYGEVFTAEREVNAMLDLVKEECYKIDSKFLEPACGTGNFLVEILRRKLSVAKNDREALISLTSIYGIDILQDNVETSRARMLEIFSKQCNLIEKARFILSNNIIWGDTLKCLRMDNNEPIIFSTWIVDNELNLSYTEHAFQNLLK
jgi:SAM-dependent methyltransferase